MSRLRPTSSKTLKVKMHLVAAKIALILEQEMGDSFGVIFDGWTHGSTHYVALFCIYMDGGAFRQRLLSISPVVDGSQTADVHIEHFKRVLDLYQHGFVRCRGQLRDQSRNCQQTGTSLGRMRQPPPQPGCASFFLQQYMAELDQVNALMVQLRHPNNSAELAKFTDLRSIKRNATRWSCSCAMVSRYLKIRGEIRKVETAEGLLPSASANRKLMALKEDLGVFISVCKKLQDEETTMADTRLLFNSLLEKYPNLGTHLAPNAKIVHSPTL